MDHLTPTSILQVSPPEDDPDDGRALMRQMVAMLRARMSADPCPSCGRGPADIKAADLEMIRKFLADSSVSLASIRRGDFGGVVQRAAEQFPFDEQGQMVQ